MVTQFIRPAGGYAALRRLHKYYPNQPSLVWQLDHFLRGMPSSELYWGSPKHLAHALKLEIGAALYLIAVGAHEGLFELVWLPRCPGCGHFTHEGHDHLMDFDLTGLVCWMCETHYHVEADQTLYLSFRTTPTVRAVGDPGLTLEQKEAYLEQWGLTPAWEMLELDAFRTYLSALNLPPGEAIGVREQTFWFTDLVSSTRMYEQLGDALAYALVRQHYDILFRAAETHGGFAVKTIGDGTMGNFRSPAQALAAAIEAVRAVRQLGGEQNWPLKVRMGLHTGPALIVSLNERLDFFGTTVNLAARIETQATGDDMVLSEAFLADAETRRVAEASGKLSAFNADLRGLAETQQLYRLQV